MTHKGQQSVKDNANAFHQQVRMASVQVTGLRPDELAMALAYEVEPFSGIPASEAEVTYVPAVDPDPAVRVFDVTVKRKKNRSATGGARFLVPLLVVGALALVLAAVDFFFTHRRLGALRKEVAVQANLEAQLDAVRRPTTAARAEAQALRERRETAARAQDEAARARSAYAEIMKAIAAAYGERAVLMTLDGGPSSLRIKGVAVTAAAAADVQVALTKSATKLGWRLMPGPIAVRTPGLTAEFECELTHD